MGKEAFAPLGGPLAVITKAGVVGVGNEDGGEVEDEMEIGTDKS